MSRMRFTKEGYKKIKEEYEDLLQKRPAVLEDLKKAREMGDLKENGYYKASKSRLSFIDGRLTTLSYHLRNAIIVEETETDAIQIGKKVTLSNGKREVTYYVVGDLEADPTLGKISLRSPLGQAIDGHRKGEEIQFETPSGKITYTILDVS